MFETVVPVVEVAARVREATSSLASVARDAGSWTSPERASALAAVRAGEAALAEARAHLLVADRAAGDSLRPGDRSFEAAHARVTRSGVGEAARVVRQADALVSMGTVAQAVRDGSVPLGHLDELARVAASASPEVAAVLRSTEAQATVVGMARGASRPDFGRTLARWVATLDPAAVQDAHDAQHRERFFALSVQSHGVFLKGRLDRVAGESLRVALDAMGQYGDETRSPGQAGADALTMLAERAMGASPATTVADSDPAGPAATVGPGTVSRPHVSLLVPAETVAELITHQRALQAADEERSGGAADEAGPGAPLCAPISLPWGTVAPATLEDGTPVAMSELARVLCEADLTRIVMTAESVPLDVGRTRRLFTAAQRRAAIARDRGCVWNGCEQHASRCEVHHIAWWDRDTGPTSISNAALLCKHHHSETHRLNLNIQRLQKPPGTRRQHATAGAVAATRAATTGMADTLDGLLDTPTTTGAPLRYVFRNHRGHIINAPDDPVGRGSTPDG